MTERREGNLQCIEDISLIKVWTSTIKDDVLDNKETSREQGKELSDHIKKGCPESARIEKLNGIIVDLKLEFASLRSEIKMTNKILIGVFSLASIIAGIVFGILEYFKTAISG